MMNRLQLARSQNRTGPSSARAPVQSWRRTPPRSADPSACACGGGCPNCQASAPPQASTHAAQSGESWTTTIPFSAEIRATTPSSGASAGSVDFGTAASPGMAVQGKSLHDEPGPTPGEIPAAQAETATATGAELAPTPAIDRDDGTLYIEQMGGLPAMKDTSGVADAVSASFAYSTTTTQGGIVLGASEFGQTTGSLKHFSNVAITPGAGKFSVTADLKQTVNWDTRATLGPDNQVEIADDNDPDLSKTNYPTAVSDLTPDISDLKGRPPRTKFWAKDLTVRHEKYHVKDFVDIGKSSATGAETWLAGQNAAKKEDVPALLDKAWNDKIFKEWDKFTDPPKVEERAYDDGVASYKALAAAIKAKGDKGGYP